MGITSHNTINEIVEADRSTIVVFESLGINFFRGNRTINEVCESRNIEPGILITNLEEILKHSPNNSSYYKM